MKQRIAKKWATRYLKRKDWTPYGIGSVGVGDYEKVLAVFPVSVCWEVWKKAYRNGWDGCHWTDPLVLEVRRWDDEQSC